MGLELTDAEIALRLAAVKNQRDRITPIILEIERLLGPARPVVDVLKTLDAQYKAEGRPAVYFLNSDEPIGPHLDEVCRMNADRWNARGVAAFRDGDQAGAIVSYEAALDVLAGEHAQLRATLVPRMNRGAALREFGLVVQARDDLAGALRDMEVTRDVPVEMKGWARYQLALCHWRLGDRGAARELVEGSLVAYDKAPKDVSAVSVMRKESEDLLAALKGGQEPPPLPAVDGLALLEAARARHRACEALTRLPLDRAAAPLLDHMLGPARPTAEVFATLDRQYREQGKPRVWFLPLSEPIAPHLDELLSPPREAGVPEGNGPGF